MTESASTIVSENRPAPRHPIVWLAATVFLIAMSVATWRTEPLQSANDRSRWCTVWSLVERGTYRIDEIDQNKHWTTIDKVRHQSSGSEEYHFYSSKPPLFPTMVAGLYWLQKNIFAMDLKIDSRRTAQSLLILINVLPFCLGLLAFEKSLRLLKVSSGVAATMLIVAASTSMLNPFLTTLNNHTPAATTLMFCLAALIRIQQGGKNQTQTMGDYVIVGFTAALVCCFELPAALFGVLSFFAVLRTSFKKTLIGYVPAAIVPLAAFFITNIICTDGIKPFYTFYGTEKYEYIHEGIPSYWMNPKGIDANQEHPAVYFFHCVFGHHGLLSLTPLFLLALPGWFCIFKQPTVPGWKLVGAMGAFLSLAILSFYLSRTQNYNYGGNTSGLRWMLWLTPFWWYAMTPMISKLLKSFWGIVVLTILSAASAYSSIDCIGQAWRPNWIYRHAERSGWIDYRTKIPNFKPERFSVLNPSDNLPAGNSFRFGGSEDARGKTIVISTSPATGASLAEHDVFQFWHLQILNSDNRPIREAQLVVSVNEIKKGTHVASWLKSANKNEQPDDWKFTELSEAPAWSLRILTGLVVPKSYRSASERYLKYQNSADEPTAVLCERGAARIQVQHPDHGLCWQQCDISYCDQLPLGVARWTVTLTSSSSNKVIRRETWTCRDLP